MKNHFIIAACIATLTVLSACNSNEQFYVRDDSSAASIFTAAQNELNRGRLTEAADYYMEVERLYPFTPEAQQALLLAAQAYHDDGALVESRMAANRYLQYFPGSPEAPLAAYLVALSYYDGMVDVKRDQSRTFEALKALQFVIDTYPDSQYAALSRPKFEIAINQLAGKEMDIGRYYLQQDHFAAAIGRFKAVIDEYPIGPNTIEAYHRLVEAYLRMGLRNEAQATYAKMSTQFPDSPWTARSHSLITTGNQENAGASIWRRILTGSGL